MGDYYTPGSSQEAVLVAARTGGDFFLTVFQSGWQGLVSFRGPLNQGDFRQQLGLLGLSQGVQDQIASISSGQVFTFSYIGVPENFATNWGMELHDGDMPNGPNDVVFTRIESESAQDKLIVHVVLNKRDRGFADWHGLKKCLASNPPRPGEGGGYTPAQLDQIEAQLKSTGTSTLKPSNGSEGGMVYCIAVNRPITW